MKGKGESSGPRPDGSGHSRRSSRRIAGKFSYQYSRRIAGPYSCWIGGGSLVRLSRRIAGCRSRLTRSSPCRSSRLPGWRDPLDMAWPDVLDTVLVDACFKEVENGIYVTEFTHLFWQNVTKSINEQTNMTISLKDLQNRFKYFKDLWGRYNKLTRQLSNGAGPIKLSLEEIKKELESGKYERMLQYLDQLTHIFVSCDEHKSPSVAAYRANIRCGNLSSASTGKRSIDETSSSHVRQKSSKVHVAQSLQNGMTHEDAMQYLKDHGILGGTLKFCIANKLLKDYQNLSTFSRLESLEERISFLEGTWKLESDGSVSWQ